VEDVNEDQKSVMFHRIMKYFNHDLKGKTIGLWGLSFKPHTDDMREAPSLVLIRKLREAGARVKAYDPVAMKEAKRILGKEVDLAEDPYDAIKGADCLLLVTEWPEFRVPDFDLVKKLLRTPVVFDGRNIFDVGNMKKMGFDYFCIGIKTD
jgi:UDPglucose 6-dehydrogenase